MGLVRVSIQSNQDRSHKMTRSGPSPQTVAKLPHLADEDPTQSAGVLRIRRNVAEDPRGGKCQIFSAASSGDCGLHEATFG